jgi:hypothetical protein
VSTVQFRRTAVYARVALVTAMSILWAPVAPLLQAQTAAKVAPAKPAASPTAAPQAQVDGGWPRAYTTNAGAALVVYQPQVASWADQRHAVLYSAVSYAAKGAPWLLYGIGAVIAVLMNMLGIAPLAFALGMYIPLSLNTPILVGAIVAHLVQRSAKKDEALANARRERGTLIASGFNTSNCSFATLGESLSILPEATIRLRAFMTASFPTGREFCLAPMFFTSVVKSL